LAHKTRCPKCSTVYVISDRQLLRSKGKVRCSRCRERFVAQIYREETDQVNPVEEFSTPNDRVTQDKDIEDQSSESTPIVISGVGYELSPFTEEFESEMTSEIISEVDFSEGESAEPLETPFSGYQASFEENLQSELTIEMESELFELIEANCADETLNTYPVDGHFDQQLISEVDELIDEKLIDGSQSTIEVFSSTELEFKDAISDVNRWRQWFINPFLSLIVVLLVATLLYQLWHRQALIWLEDERLSRVIAPIAEPLIGKLSEEFDVTLPVRRDLRNLQLLSAHTEAHPTRSSTLLLRVSIINHSKIAQPFPWLELTLSDENGRLVARRAMSPADYLHNNRLGNSIASKEVRPVTIEFLSFPEHAHGFELRLLNK